MTISPELPGAAPPVDPRTGLAPMANFALSSHGAATGARSPHRSLADGIAARARPGRAGPRRRAAARLRFPFEPATRRMVRRYGTHGWAMLGEARVMADLGRGFGTGLTGREMEWQMRKEWARTPEDVLWRRSKLGLRLGTAGRAALAGFMAALVPAGRAAE